MTLIYHPRMSHQPNDPEYKICYHYAEMLIKILNHPIKICYMRQGEGDPRGGGIVMSPPFQEGVGP